MWGRGGGGSIIVISIILKIESIVIQPFDVVLYKNVTYIFSQCILPFFHRLATQHQQRWLATLTLFECRMYSRLVILQIKGLVYEAWIAYPADKS